jgi:hypothetical protein
VANACCSSSLSKHPTLDPGVWRDEITTAFGVKGDNRRTFLVESEQKGSRPLELGL